MLSRQDRTAGALLRRDHDLPDVGSRRDRHRRRGRRARSPCRPATWGGAPTRPGL